ncbi:MAG: Omp28-related outer membrane protein [Tannerella sp.]|jgi:hypothetical protein|nr:Omp28-related outer membrane protein [Tannerella sp.]
MNFKNNISSPLYLLYAFAIAFSGCSDAEEEPEKLQNIILSVDKNELKSDGHDIVTFSIRADEKDISSDQEAEIMYREENRALSGNAFSTGISGTHRFYATYKGLQSPEVQVNARPPVLALSADATSLKANGKSAVTFSATLDGENVTGSAEIFYRDGDAEVVLENNTFTTGQTGSYEFYGRYGELVSNAVTVTATPFVLTLTSDRTAVKTGEEVTFTAISDEMDDVSASIALHITRNGSEEVFNSRLFIPSSFGSYSVYATFEERTSGAVEIEVTPASVTVSADKGSVMATGVDAATFSVFADGIQVADGAEIYRRGEPEDLRLAEHLFATNLEGAYTFYAQYAGIQSGDIRITASRAAFYGQSCAMEVVATWCGYSPQLITVFHEIKKQHSDRIQILSLHRSASGLESRDVDAEDFLTHYGWDVTPFGILDLSNVLLIRRVERIYELHQSMRRAFPATSGIAIVSEKTANSIQVEVNVKVNVTDEYRVYAFIVEDDVVKRQTIYTDDQTVRDDNFVSQAVATYSMPGDYRPYEGKSLGVIQNGEMVAERFSIPLDKAVTDRVINYSNCRVIAYTLKKNGDRYYINNVATCPVDGSVDYKYE